MLSHPRLCGNRWRIVVFFSWLGLGGVVFPVLAADQRSVYDPSATEVNKFLGLELFLENSPNSPWSELTQIVAERLHLSEESMTSYESSYLNYTMGKLIVCGCRAFSLSLTGGRVHPASFSILFANKGDIETFADAQDQPGLQRMAQANRALHDSQAYVSAPMIQRCEAEIIKDHETIKNIFTALFGSSKPATVGKGTWTTEYGERWDWRGTTFFLVSAQKEYAALRLFPTAVFDDKNSYRSAFAAAKSDIPNRVKRSPNGDVLIEMSMIDQGGKGYCFVTSISRMLRYYGISIDMNLLAKAAMNSPGGGSCGDLFGVLSGPLGETGARLAKDACGETMGEIKAHIDQGQPLSWGLFSSQEFNLRADDRTRRRKVVTDWNKWADELTIFRATAIKLAVRENAHSALIVGYNERTREVAVSDSWGENFAVRWLTIEEVHSAADTLCSFVTW